jgi:hypothetical protein
MRQFNNYPQLVWLYQDVFDRYMEYVSAFENFRYCNSYTHDARLKNLIIARKKWNEARTLFSCALSNNS